MTKEKKDSQESIFDQTTSDKYLEESREAYLEVCSHVDLFQGEIYEYINNGEYCNNLTDGKIIRFLLMCRTINFIQAELSVILNNHLGICIEKIASNAISPIESSNETSENKEDSREETPIEDKEDVSEENSDEINDNSEQED